jgi:hypothetical protein|tara:strand:+ start:457 stop:1089 length:633 start_codon:yes stop_codon:yes gene_type:complete
MRNILEKSMPISLDEFIQIDDKIYKDIDIEIQKGFKRLPSLLIGKKDNGERYWIEKGEAKVDWEVIPLTDSVYGDPDFYSYRPWNRFINFFPKLKKFVESLPTKGLGRASILKVKAGHESIPHIDPQFLPLAAPIEKYDRILNICFGTIKPLYVLEPRLKTKHYFNGRMNWLDVSDWHGVESSNEDTYTLKLDVLLDDSIRQTIKEKYNV